jgi:hypothetical protein
MSRKAWWMSLLFVLLMAGMTSMCHLLRWDLVNYFFCDGDRTGFKLYSSQSLPPM